MPGRIGRRKDIVGTRVRAAASIRQLSFLWESQMSLTLFSWMVAG